MRHDLFDGAFEAFPGVGHELDIVGCLRLLSGFHAAIIAWRAVYGLASISRWSRFDSYPV